VAGNTCSQIDARVSGILADGIYAQTDVLLTLCGYNDINQGASPDQALANFDAYIRHCSAARPGMKYVLTTETDLAPANTNLPNIKVLNGLLPNEFTALSNAGLAVYAIDLYKGLSYSSNLWTPQ
jgi:hypothetical protein